MLHQHQHQHQAPTAHACSLTTHTDKHHYHRPRCRLLDFTITDDNGVAQPLSNLELVKEPLYFSGVVHPVEGAISKAAGRRVAQSGQLRGWRVHFTGPEMQVGGWVCSGGRRLCAIMALQGIW